MKTIRQNTFETLHHLFRKKAQLPEQRASSLAIQLSQLMGLDGPKGESVEAKIIWFDMDHLYDEGIDAVEVM